MLKFVPSVVPIKFFQRKIQGAEENGREGAQVRDLPWLFGPKCSCDEPERQFPTLVAYRESPGRSYPHLCHADLPLPGLRARVE